MYRNGDVADTARRYPPSLCRAKSQVDFSCLVSEGLAGK